MDKVLEILKNNDIEVTEEIKESLNNLAEEGNETKTPLDQTEVNKIVKDQLDQERSAHESEIEKLKTEMKDLVDPEKVEEYESKIKGLEESKARLKSGLIKDYELKMAALKEGVEDIEYFEYLVEKNQVKDKLRLNDDNILNVTDQDGNFLTEGGKKVGVEMIISEMKEDKPDLFTGGGKKDTSGPTNPDSSVDLDEYRRENTKKIAEEMGYAK